MMKYVRNSLEMYGMGSEIERYGVDSWKKSDISEKCRKSRKNESSQNEVLYIGKCSHVR